MMRYKAQGTEVFDTITGERAGFLSEYGANSAALKLNNEEVGREELYWKSPRYVVDSTDPECFKVRDTTSSRYAPFSTSGGASRTAAELNNGGDDNYYAWIADATHEELSRKDEPEPELEEWERELLASYGIVEIPEKRFTAEAYTDEEGKTYGIVRDTADDTFAPMAPPFDAAMWVTRLNADMRKSHKLVWLDGEPSDYFE